jgi:hypothetical protein
MYWTFFSFFGRINVELSISHGVLHQKLIVAQQAKKFAAFYEAEYSLQDPVLNGTYIV